MQFGGIEAKDAISWLMLCRSRRNKPALLGCWKELEGQGPRTGVKISEPHAAQGAASAVA